MIDSTEELWLTEGKARWDIAPAWLGSTNDGGFQPPAANPATDWARLPFRLRPQYRFWRADSAGHFARGPTSVPPGSYCHGSAAALPESSRPPTARGSSLPDEIRWQSGEAFHAPRPTEYPLL